MQIGSYSLGSKVLLAPMAGVTDRPFRQLCRRLGAALAVSEMVSADLMLWNRAKTRRRLDHTGEDGPRSVQIVGHDPQMMATAARLNVELGAQIIDINMGCPARKVCNVLAGSALLRDEPLVARLLEAVVAAVPVPVTLKIRTGWDPAHRNGVRIAAIAEAAGVQALAVHGRTRACGYGVQAEYETIRMIKQAVQIPVIANGDIDGPERARQVLDMTGADAVMVGRAAQGRPWIFREITRYLDTGERSPPPSVSEVRDILLGHLEQLYTFYGAACGVRIARKHLGWYSRDRADGAGFRAAVNRVEMAREQMSLTRTFFDRLADEERLTP
jgi:tRNA-dihydrouridine synthase B